MTSSSSQFISTEFEDNNWYNPANERIYDVRKKSFLPVSQLKVLQKELNGQRIVSIGELHSNPCHHRVEFNIIKSLVETRNPGTLSIGLECFYRQHQKALDDYVFRHRDFGTLKASTKWDSTWGYDLNYYAKIFNYACVHGIRLVGLNVPYPVIKLVSNYGLANLPADLRRLLPDIDLSNEDHKAQFLELMGVHGEVQAPAALQRYYEAQCLWDEYMAETASNLIRKDSKAESLLVLITGAGHVMGRTGIPNRIQKRCGQLPFVIVPQQVDWSSTTGLPDVEHPPSFADCDWAWYTEKEVVVGEKA